MPFNRSSAISVAPAAAAVTPVSADETSRAIDDDHDAFIAWIFLEAGLSARHYRPSSLHRRLPACFRALRVEGVAQARRLLRRHPRFISTAVDALLLGVTEFFRDAAVFSVIERALPELLRAADNGKNGNRTLRVWSAGCSDGAELYSVAMMLADLDALHCCDLLGTDCRPEALATAANGIFCGGAGLRGLPRSMLERHTSPEDCRARSAPDGVTSRRVDARLRGAVRWLKADLLVGPQPGPWDLVLCRNVAMYLEPLAADRLWRGIVSSLRPGGLLVLGKAERPSASAAASELSSIAPCVYRRRYGAP